MDDMIDENEASIKLGQELASWAINAIEIWKQDRLEPLKLHFLDVLKRRLQTIYDDEIDPRVNAVTELESCLEQWTEKRAGLLVEARQALRPLYERLEPLFGSEGIDQLVLNRLHLVSEGLHIQAHKMMFREIDHEDGMNEIDRILKILDFWAQETGAKIYLFGSRARGDHRDDSDVDVFVEWPSDSNETFVEWWTNENDNLFKRISNLLCAEIQILDPDDKEMQKKIRSGVVVGRFGCAIAVLLPRIKAPPPPAPEFRNSIFNST